MADELPRGLRNNNPGNIRINPANKWQGLAPQQFDSEFCTFKDIPYGIRAMARLLISYQDKKSARTLDQLISTWAPASENNVKNYTGRVGLYMTNKLEQSFTEGTPIDTHDYAELRALIEGMIRVETGLPWDAHITDAQMVKGLTLAGIEPAKKPLQKSRVIKGQQVVAVATVGGAVIDKVSQLNDIQTQLQPLVDYSEYIKYAFLAVALAGVALTVWAKIDDRRKGVS